jgi:hypothetical protein
MFGPKSWLVFIRARQMVNPIVHMKQVMETGHAGMRGTVQCKGNAFISTGT